MYTHHAGSPITIQAATTVSAVVVGMTSNGLILADPDDSSMLDVVGFNNPVPAVIANFVRE